jgi:N-methylhydantoinase A
LDVRSVGAGGGSIAHVPELTRALRVGPQSAGADPGPAAYGRGGENPTVTDANVVLGRLPTVLADQTQLDKALSEKAVQTVADGLGLDLKRGAEGIIDIVNENMYGAMRLVSVEQGYDPREFALIAFGGAGPLHANAIGRLTQSWPVIIPPSPGVLCAYGDATTRLRNEASQTLIRRFSETTNVEIGAILGELAERAAQALDAENVPRSEQTTQYQLDCRYRGQGFVLTTEVNLDELREGGLELVSRRFADLHTQMFTFAPEVEPEVVNLRAIAQGQATIAKARAVERGSADASGGKVGSTSMYVDGAEREAAVYDRSKLLAGNRILGPAMITEMDSTTLILPEHLGEVDSLGNILINPVR